MMDKVWYYMKPDRKKYGPFNDIELIRLISQEILLETDYIWMPDLENWLKVGNSVYAFYLPANRNILEDTIQ